jgi:hypothetical protein
MFAGRDLFCVTACKSDFLFEVRHLLNDETSVLHGTRLKFLLEIELWGAWSL